MSFEQRKLGGVSARYDILQTKIQHFLGVLSKVHVYTRFKITNQMI